MGNIRSVLGEILTPRAADMRIDATDEGVDGIHA